MYEDVTTKEVREMPLATTAQAVQAVVDDPTVDERARQLIIQLWAQVNRKPSKIILEARERNVYLLQTTLDRVCKAARNVIDSYALCMDQDDIMLEALKRLEKALNSK